ncbi:hypothetical protein [Streptomyces sp. NBC_00344]|uniref:hypothetical protein n=1 Tax=Streptomyces sp. NBC_00344 TaxID=2975720 RepID=UPI002E1B4651
MDTSLRGFPGQGESATRSGRPTALAAMAAVSLIGTVPAGPAHARVSAAGAAACTPSIRVLHSLPDTGSSQVNGFGPRGLTVGVSQSLPVCWTGRSVHRVPLPSG